MNLSSKKLIIWDWNGTLLDDVELCVDCMNVLLTKRELPPLTVSRYREIFTFPVKEYYLRAGFDFRKEAFEKPAMEFIELYYRRVTEAGLFPCVQEVLGKLKSQGLAQLVLSAMEHQSLERTLSEKGILGFFGEVSGITDHYAHSKLEIGKQLLSKQSVPKDEMLLVGDTLHDWEVARGLGVDCLLVARGHQSRQRLLEKTENVLESLEQLPRLLAGT